MDATLYTGTGTTQVIVNNAQFQPDFVWVKGRSGATDHALYDSVRGTTKDLASNSTAAETTQSTGLTAFNTNGFTVGALAKMNTSAATYVGWQWQAGQSSGSSNTSGSITSTVSANTTAGFSIVTYSGNGTAGATVGHGLGVAPKLVIIKNRTEAGDNWQTWFTGFGTSGTVNRVYLNTTSALDPTTTNYFYPNSTNIVMNSGDHFFNSASYTYVAYCWAEIAGFSKMGSYTGNGSSDGPFVYLGFRPKFILVKLSSGVENWFTFDSARGNYNDNNPYLLPNSSAAEGAFTAPEMFANGFKWNTTSTALNGSGSTYIYAAYAENPFKNANAR
jgi:hypothetical protein